MPIKRNKQTKKANIETEVMTSVATIVDFIKQQVKKDIVKCKNEGYVDLDESDIQKLTNILDASIASAFSRSSTEVINVLRKFEN